MTPMPNFEMHDGGAAPEPMALPTFRIMRSGRRPLTFEGVELCMAMSFVPGSPFWYEINIYRTRAQKFVAAVRIFFASEDERDRVRVWECESFDDVLDALEGYDAAEEIRVDLFPGDRPMSPAELAGQGFALMARAGAARAQYAGLLGEILHELEGQG